MRPVPPSIRPVLPRRLISRGRTPRVTVLGALALALVTALATSAAAPAGALGPAPFLAGFNTVSTMARRCRPTVTSTPTGSPSSRQPSAR